MDKKNYTCPKFIAEKFKIFFHILPRSVQSPLTVALFILINRIPVLFPVGVFFSIFLQPNVAVTSYKTNTKPAPSTVSSALYLPFPATNTAGSVSRNSHACC